MREEYSRRTTGCVNCVIRRDLASVIMNSASWMKGCWQETAAPHKDGEECLWWKHGTPDQEDFKLKAEGVEVVSLKFISQVNAAD